MAIDEKYWLKKRILALRYLATHKRKVGSKEMSNFLDVTQRTAMRILSDLVELGVVECDGSNPKGYIFSGLELTNNKKPQ